MPKDHINRLLNEIEALIRSDSYHLNRDAQTSLEIKLDEFRRTLNETYGKNAAVVDE